MAPCRKTLLNESGEFGLTATVVPAHSERSALIDALKSISTCDISDAFTQLGLNAVRMSGILPLKPFETERHIAGPAVTLRFLPCHRKEQYQESPMKLTEVVDAAPRGSVLVVAAEGPEPVPPIQGELNCLTEIRSGLEAHVGATPLRDIDRLLELPMPMFHLQSPARFGMSSYVGGWYCAGAHEPVHCGGALVRPDDIIVGDNNGVVVVPQEELERVTSTALQIVELESRLREKIHAGVRWTDIYPAEHKRKYMAQ